MRLGVLVSCYAFVWQCVMSIVSCGALKEVSPSIDGNLLNMFHVTINYYRKAWRKADWVYATIILFN